MLLLKRRYTTDCLALHQSAMRNSNLMFDLLILLLLDGPTSLPFKNCTVCLHSILYLFQNKQQILPCIPQTDWFLQLK